ncbi:hypothetical protein COCOBI_19-1930 [Coccomyxa sp. Obi]|nr:hypothetical protein COCOBI_19-1930 [Coccomyxa sp. Obi]
MAKNSIRATQVPSHEERHIDIIEEAASKCQQAPIQATPSGPASLAHLSWHPQLINWQPCPHTSEQATTEDFILPAPFLPGTTPTAALQAN